MDWLTSAPTLPLPTQLAGLLVQHARNDVLRKIQMGIRMAAQSGASAEGFWRLYRLIEQMPLEELTSATRERSTPSQDRNPVRHLKVRVVEGSEF